MSHPPLVEGQLLWSPSETRKAAASITAFMRFVEARRGLAFGGDYARLHRWSVECLEDFWADCWDYFKVESSTPYEHVVSGSMPSARWFTGSLVNYAEHSLRLGADNDVAITHLDESQQPRHVTRAQLRADVRVAATQLRRLGVQPGQRVVAYLPNCYEAAVAFLASTAIGAVWSTAAPEFGVQTVVDRFAQIEPTVLIACDGYRFAGKPFDRRAQVQQIVDALPSLKQVIWVDRLGQPCELQGPPCQPWAAFMDAIDPGAQAFQFERVACDHPLWVVYSSGTTGLPKPIVHSHVGVLMEVLTNLELQHDVRSGKRLFFYANTGWIMWNLTMAALVTGASIVLYDGHPAYPLPDVLWQMASELQVTMFGASPTYVQIMQKAGLRPRDHFDFSHLDSVLVSGSPAMPETFAWFLDAVKADLWVASSSGGTDIAGAFVAGCPLLPVHAGEIQCRALGHDVQAWDDNGQPVVDRVGELMCVQPVPSMPIYFWNDAGNQRYLESYFADTPGHWKHGDFLKLNARGGAYIYGRSDSTLNRFGVRIGTAELYRAVEHVEGIADSLVVCCELDEGQFFMPMFLQLKAGVALDQALIDRVSARLREQCSPRHVPDRFYAVNAIPYTLTGKKMEVPVRKLLMGWPLARAANPGAMANPAALDYFVEFARSCPDYTHPRRAIN
jgi:acetoacetyl-CoA synthetase